MQANDIKGLNACFTSAALTATGAETVYDTTVTLVHVIDGRLYSGLTAVTDGATPTADPVDSVTFTGLEDGEGCVFVWVVDVDSTVGVFQGPVSALDADDAFLSPDAPQFPSIPDGYVAFAYQILKHGAAGSGTWNFGTDNWNATGVEDVIVNVSTLPLRPAQDATS